MSDPLAPSQCAPPVQPFFMQLAGRRCLVVGSEGEAVEKCEQLLAAGAHVVWQSESSSEQMQLLRQKYPIEWVQGPFELELLDGVWLVLCSGTEPALLPELYRACEERQIFLNVVDVPAYCSLIWPAQIQRGVVSIAISTGGSSPALARWIRQQIEMVLPEPLGALALWLKDQRGRVKHLLTESFKQRAGFWSGLFKAGLVECYLQNGPEAAQKRVDTALEKEEGRR
ncbi:precorrin-2 dehydrogenase/sirohydrochlorin ferrochelatase family protein [Magnetococcus sp. PR-3]|uniref:precorrin-2 dehydrogenase/sirohydrochlorin ferrochelatase family protein n=1 Tax=Magnetococcus sp. PR-3 TaxID=3120355 RepID=UPI002FCE62A8